MQKERAIPTYTIRSEERQLSDEEEMLEAKALVLRESRLDGRNEWETLDERCPERDSGIAF